MSSLLDLPLDTLLYYFLGGAVFLAGFIIALITWRKHPPVSLIVATATAVMLLTDYLRLRKQADPDYYLTLFSLPQEAQHRHYLLESIPNTIVFLALAITALSFRLPRPSTIVPTEDSPDSLTP